MDAAKRIAEWRELTPAQWLTLANRLLPPIATAALVIATAYGLARLTWQMVPGARLDAPAPEVAAAPSGTGGAGGAGAESYSGLLDSHLFGKAEVKKAPVADTPVDAPDTTLNLELTGTQATGDSRRGQAIIASGRGHEKAYSVGDAIQGTNGVKLHAVYPDRVLLDRNGQLETLRLPKAKAGQATAAAAPAPAPGASRPSVRKIISDNATKISKVIRLAPHIEGGKMVGFRVSPGPDRKAFEALGLQPGDVVTDVNGTAVNDPSKGLKVYQALGEATVANVTVLRNGNPQVIAIDTSKLQNVAKNLQ